MIGTIGTIISYWLTASLGACIGYAICVFCFAAKDKDREDE